MATDIAPPALDDAAVASLTVSARSRWRVCAPSGSRAAARRSR